MSEKISLDSSDVGDIRDPGLWHSGDKWNYSRGRRTYNELTEQYCF